MTRTRHNVDQSSKCGNKQIALDHLVAGSRQEAEDSQRCMGDLGRRVARHDVVLILMGPVRCMRATADILFFCGLLV
jgi:hypothetical protein